MASDGLITLRGIVIPTGWNTAGAVVAVAIATYREEKLAVADTPTGRKLLSMLQKRVIIEGVALRHGEEMTIDVRTVRPDASPV